MISKHPQVGNILDSLVPFAVPRKELTSGISIFDGRTVTRILYTQLVEDVTRTRKQLQEAGLKAGSCVGLVGENCYEWIVHDLAVLSLGCILVCFPTDEFAEKSAEDLAQDYDLSLLLVTAKVGGHTDLPWVVCDECGKQFGCYCTSDHTARRSEPTNSRHRWMFRDFLFRNIGTAQGAFAVSCRC